MVETARSEPTRVHAAVAALTTRFTGLDVARDAVWTSVDRHVRERCAALGTSVEGYLESLDRAPDGAEARALVEAATVPHTWLFRDVEPLERLVESLRSRGAPARVWVAGCASGEEAFTLAMVAARAGVTMSIIATDIRASSIARAKSGTYGRLQGRAMPAWAKTLGLVLERPDGSLAIAASLRESVRFEVLNLLAIPPSMSGFDAIVCRNVLLYFAGEHANRTHERLLGCLAPGGELLLGPCDAFRLTSPAAAELPATGAAAPPPARTAPPSPAEAAGPVTEAPDDSAEVALDAEAPLLAGIAALARDELEAAVSSLRAAAFLEPSLGIAHYELGVAFERLGEWDRAELAFRRAAECPPGGGLTAGTALPAELLELAADLGSFALRRIALLGRARGALAHVPPSRGANGRG